MSMPEEVVAEAVAPEAAAVASPITVSVTTDKTVYNVGDAIDVSVTYTDSSKVTHSLTVTATVSDAQGNTGTGTATATVEAGQATLPVTVTDNFGDVYAEASNSGGAAKHTSTVGPVPAGM